MSFWGVIFSVQFLDFHIFEKWFTNGIVIWNPRFWKWLNDIQRFQIPCKCSWDIVASIIRMKNQSVLRITFSVCFFNFNNSNLSGVKPAFKASFTPFFIDNKMFRTFLTIQCKKWTFQCESIEVNLNLWYIESTNYRTKREFVFNRKKCNFRNFGRIIKGGSYVFFKKKLTKIKVNRLSSQAPAGYSPSCERAPSCEPWVLDEQLYLSRRRVMAEHFFIVVFFLRALSQAKERRLPLCWCISFETLIRA